MDLISWWCPLEVHVLKGKGKEVRVCMALF